MKSAFTRNSISLILGGIFHNDNLSGILRITNVVFLNELNKDIFDLRTDFLKIFLDQTRIPIYRSFILCPLRP
jgi:hypothetical protein